ncbi:hypothetical protein SRB5_70660 [Streptomyces sp. RB5]|uniref:Uncharacterized protein n=1 Tax=Streptomyces smaragdinus TaxID=2585196 RepID=A0A7K0CU24_9ACTN|nr:hypothetical protein [Streptomyces smaragdinus]MQY16863.1 hypothetical protein [Streptomyces smaragdinus]
MSTQNLLMLLLALVVLAAVAVIAGLIGYSVAREGGSPVSTAIGRGSVVFFSAMTLFIALLAVLVPAVT